MNQFTNGHALLIGVGADLAVTVSDANGIATILRDPERCAYPTDQVTLLTESAATRYDVLNALDQLASQTDSDATVIFYFSGHGYAVDGGFGKQYFLMPYGYNTSDLITTAISGQEFIQKLNAIPAQKMLVLLDCCHAGGMDHAKAPSGPQFAKAPLPADTIEFLNQGSGRVVIASSRADELSQTGVPYSQFTMALVEAFAGCGVAEKDGYVRAADLAMYASRVVPEHTKDQQHPILNFEQADNFAVAYYAGGDPEPKGLPDGMERKSHDNSNDPSPSISATNSSSGAIAQGDGAVAAGERGVAIGGDSSGSTIVTGDNSQVDQSINAFNQPGQTIYGGQTNISLNAVNSFVKHSH